MTQEMADTYQTPEQKARVHIDTMLTEAGWKVQDKNKIDFSVGLPDQHSPYLEKENDAV